MMMHSFCLADQTSGLELGMGTTTTMTMSASILAATAYEGLQS
jgi:hypothetical protein